MITSTRTPKKRRPAAAIARRAVTSLNNAYLLARFVFNDAGRQHGLRPISKLRLARDVIRNTRRIPSLSRWQQHLLMVEEILRVPRDVPGDVVECGCYSGASTASLSLACAIAGRRLFVCDSFEGLPEPEGNEAVDVRVDSEYYVKWEKGDFSSVGGMAGVQERVARYGNASVCRFVKGFFKDTLATLDTRSIVLVFEDADLRSSVEDCVKYLWPKMQVGCRFYSHEPFSIHIVSLFYDERWWHENIGTVPPGFYGSGRGVISGLMASNIGFAKKIDAARVVGDDSQRILRASRRAEDTEAAGVR